MSVRVSKIEKIKPTRLAYVELVGSYGNWGKGQMEPKAWLEGQKVRVVDKPIGLFYDGPTQTPTSELKSEACLPVEGEFAHAGKFKVKELPAGIVAITKHLGPADEYTKNYGSFLEGLRKQMYSFYGPAGEILEQVRSNLSPGMASRFSNSREKALNHMQDCSPKSVRRLRA